MNNGKNLFVVSAFFLLAFLLNGCVSDRNVTFGVNYIEGSGNLSQKNKGVIYITPVHLSKDIKDTNYKVGYWERLNNQRDNYYIQGKLSEAFYSGLKTSLQKRGYTVKDRASWNLNPDDLRLFDENVMTLELKQFDTSSYSSALKVSSEFNLKLAGHLGLIDENRVHRATVALQSLPVNLSISDESVLEELNKLITEAINRVVTKLLKNIT